MPKYTFDQVAETLAAIKDELSDKRNPVDEHGTCVYDVAVTDHVQDHTANNRCLIGEVVYRLGEDPSVLPATTWGEISRDVEHGAWFDIRTHELLIELQRTVDNADFDDEYGPLAWGTYIDIALALSAR